MNKYLSVSDNLTLKDLTNTVSSQKIDTVLAVNNLTRSPNIGKQVSAKQADAVRNTKEVSWQEKLTALNAATSSSDVFEELALMGSDDWKVVKTTGSLPGRIIIPESVEIQQTAEVLGNGVTIGSDIYKKATSQISKPPYEVDPSIFNVVSGAAAGAKLPNQSSRVIATQSGSDPFMYYRIPWGEVTLYSSLADTSKQFPVYPEEIHDSRSASYTQMPDVLYQYEPWQTYQSSGPRQNSYTFDFHRDMWTGDHRDGLANELIRFCEANCYPDYNGSAVQTSNVTLFIHGKPVITGIMTECSADWSGPIGLDGFYLFCSLTISITEVSSTPLNYSAVMKKPLIG